MEKRDFLCQPERVREDPHEVCARLHRPAPSHTPAAHAWSGFFFFFLTCLFLNSLFIFPLNDKEDLLSASASHSRLHSCPQSATALLENLIYLEGMGRGAEQNHPNRFISQPTRTHWCRSFSEKSTERFQGNLMMHSSILGKTYYFQLICVPYVKGGSSIKIILRNVPWFFENAVSELPHIKSLRVSCLQLFCLTSKHRCSRPSPRCPRGQQYCFVSGVGGRFLSLNCTPGLTTELSS